MPPQYRAHQAPQLLGQSAPALPISRTIADLVTPSPGGPILPSRTGSLLPSGEGFMAWFTRNTV